MEKYERARRDDIQEFRVPLAQYPLDKGSHVVLFNVEVEAWWPREDWQTFTFTTRDGLPLYVAYNTEYGDYWVVWVYAADRARVRGKANLSFGSPGARPCEVCNYPLITHEWVDMDYNGFVVQCDRQE